MSPYIPKKNTCLKEAISPKRRLIATMRCFSNRQKLQGYEVCYENISPIIREIIMEACAAIIKGLNNYIQVSVHLL